MARPRPPFDGAIDDAEPAPRQGRTRVFYGGRAADEAVDPTLTVLTHRVEELATRLDAFSERLDALEAAQERAPDGDDDDLPL